MKTIQLIILLLCTNFLSAQVNLKGKVTENSGKGVEFLDVTILTQDSTFVAETNTDVDGNFDFEISPNKYILIIEEFGQLLSSKNLELSQDQTLETIVIERSKVDLQEVVVEGKAKTYERLVDRLVFNVENSITALGGDALDALKATPGVTVSNSSIEITGKNMVNVMINDRIIQMSQDDLQNYLKGIPAANIKKIEVITNPPAKYEASGDSGLINIVLKDAKIDAWSATLRSSYQQAHKGSTQYGGNFSYDKNKFSALVDLYGYQGNWFYQRDGNNIFPDYKMSDKSRNLNKFKGFGGGTTLNYKINDDNTIGLQYYGGSFSPNQIEKNETTTFGLDNSIRTNELTQGNTKTDGFYHQLNLNYNLKLDTIGKKFSVDLDHWNNKNDKDNQFVTDVNRYSTNSLNYERANNISNQKIFNYSGKFDFYMPYSFGVLEYGAKATFTNTNNTVDVNFSNDTDPDIGFYNKFKYQENVQALYASYSKDIGETWKIKAGLRGEFTQTEANLISENNINKRDYFKLFPTIYVQYAFNENHNVNVNFGRRINRPGFWEMNPARQYSNRYTYTLGNPFLQPSFTYNYEASYAYKSLINFKVYYQDVKDGFGQMLTQETVNENGIDKYYRYFERLNYYDMTRLGADLAINFKPFRWWESNNTISVNYNKSTVNNTKESFDGTSAWLTSFNNLTLNTKKTLLAEVNFNYRFKGTNREYTYTASNYLDFGIKYLMFDKRLTLGVMFEDTLWKDYNTMRATINNITQESTQKYDTHLVRFSLSYRFGSDKVSVDKRQSSNSDEAGRGGS